MLNFALAKIKSAPKRSAAAALTVAAVLGLGAIVFVTTGTEGASLRAGNRTYKLEVADSQAEQTKGLGGRRTLPRDTGMLFVFAQAEQQCFWMKDMHFAIDIIWLDSGRRVLHVEHNVSPDTYPQSFCPEDPARYVLELNANQAHQAGIKQGSILQF